MKKWILVLAVLFTAVLTSCGVYEDTGMSYSRARTEALYLSDKMAYELNLTMDQYNAVYEINLDYLLSLNNHGDFFGDYWKRRNYDLEYVLTVAQYQRFLAMEYFYRPVHRVSNSITLVVYNRYPRNKYFRNAPTVFSTYKGAHKQYHYSPYQGRSYMNVPSNQPPQMPNTRTPAQPTKSKSEAVRGGREQQKNDTRQSASSYRRQQSNYNQQTRSETQQQTTTTNNNNNSQQGSASRRR